MLERKHEDYTAFKSNYPSWDNTARRQNHGHIFINASPGNYRNWLSRVVRYTTQNLPEDRRFIFINAWNEWAEGTHLEPDKFNGYAYLQATAEAITHGEVSFEIYSELDAYCLFPMMHTMEVHRGFY